LPDGQEKLTKAAIAPNRPASHRRAFSFAAAAKAIPRPAAPVTDRTVNQGFATCSRTFPQNDKNVAARIAVVTVLPVLKIIP
jgi:hypothetical protein